MTDTSKMADTKQSIVLETIHPQRIVKSFSQKPKKTIDFFFNLMTLPLETVTQILMKNKMVGSIGAIYESIVSLDENYFHPGNQTKETLIKPSTPDATAQLITPLEVPAQRLKTFYLCSMVDGNHTHACIAEDPRASCKVNINYDRYNHSCNSRMYTQVRTVAYQPNSTERGYVKGEVAYMVADDLVVEALTATSVVNLRLKGIKHMNTLKQNVVYLDMDKGLKLLKASLQSKAVLTSVFLSDSKK